MRTTWVEREVPEHLEDKIHDMITFVLKAHGYGDGCEPIDLEQRREYLRQMVPKLDVMFHSEYDTYLKQHETVDYQHETVGYGFSVADGMVEDVIEQINVFGDIARQNSRGSSDD